MGNFISSSSGGGDERGVCVQLGSPEGGGDRYIQLNRKQLAKLLPILNEWITGRSSGEKMNEELMTSAEEVNKWIGLYQQSHHGDSPPISEFVKEFPEWLRREKEEKCPEGQKP